MAETLNNQTNNQTNNYFISNHFITDLYPINEIIFSPNHGEIIQIAFKIWILFFIGHFSIGFFILYKDLSGSWEKCKIIPEDKSVNKLNKYYLCIPYLFRDLFFLLPLFLVIYVNYTLNFINANFNLYDLFLKEFLFKFPLAYMIGNVWDMAVHRLWHQFPLLYKHIHKVHHININEMCSLSAWRDSLWEFILEIPGTFFIGPFIMRMNWLSHAILISSMGFISSIDHSGFYVNWLIDSRYHIQHHINPNNNFADLEIIDKLFGNKLITSSSKKI